ncbi:endonuclease/exonuclease/phosphatase family protein [Sediminibacillus massiliensis]|uniref:endonuclease/exonuclease/phosphatase family protein n=1 Tax=Sediminibacillus massiliensis TaxID=1926277 RepID=UPI0009889419|nr:endonuclease/exonuclease/phosphatase family protein [Sediminibacillus massiliensis]
MDHSANIKVMTYNIHHGKGTDGTVSLGRVAEVLAESNADIIGLIEVDKHFSKRSHYIDQLAFLAKELNFHYVFSPSITRKPTHNYGIRQYGNGLLSRYPICNSNHYVLDCIPYLVEGRSILEASIDINQKFVNIYVTHLSLYPFLHKKQREYLLNKAVNPAVILGDWNMRANSRRWKKMTQHFQDAWKTKSTKPGHTYPSSNPRFRFDYIFASECVKINEAEVFDYNPAASDHLPVLADLEI